MKDQIEQAVDQLVEDDWDTRRQADELKRAITVSELIKKLQTFPQDLPVGATGHYGEFHAIDKYNVSLHHPDYKDMSKSDWVEISGPDIGEPPD